MNNCDGNIGLLRGFLLIAPINFYHNFFIANLMKSKFSILFSFITIILGWYIYFKIALKAGSLTYSKLGLSFSYSGVLTFFTIFEKKLFSGSAVLKSLLMNYSFSLR